MNKFLSSDKWLIKELKASEKRMKRRWAKILKYLAENGGRNKGETIKIQVPKKYTTGE